MTLHSPTVLVVGAAGKFAGLVVPALLARGARVRALVRSVEEAEALRRAGVQEAVIGDLRDGASLREAASGADGVFYLGPAFSPDEAGMGVRMVQSAQAAGVRKFVFSSVIHPTQTDLANHASKIPVENALYSSGLEYTVLHPANFMQNIKGAWPRVREQGVFAEPFPTDTRIARVDYRDVAEMAAIALTQDRLAYATLELCADGAFNREEIAAMMSEALGRRIVPQAPGFKAWAIGAKLPYDAAQLALFEKVFEHYARAGLPGNSLALTAALGREPRGLKDFIFELAGRGAPPAAP
ncbi:NmrA/HSCARG family protein [Achromobacter pestifer]